MSSCLAIETATARGGVAVVRDGVTVYEQHFASERSHNSQLFPPLAEALKLCRSDLRCIVSGTGPGSYTGARIGIAAAQGLGLSLNVPVIGLLSVLTPEADILPPEFVVCGDARRGKFFAARVRRGLLEGEITLHDADEFKNLRANDAAIAWFSFDPKPPLELASITLTSPSPARLALLASTMTDESLWSLEQSPLEPHYLAEPFVTKAKPRKL
ncbi:MAG: tRNA (adenosine(37)-N6)-threonylcarbamoyltransferase complex dimerization subunit type 1 TsaB [Verrucomicrobia bacterium]|nr:tRNA (adenosine(37)-N6)-threonylcarbamoyltransferase complex dimerization subunit type 1 TsaB [Verrucomicrobiota bacterium]